MLGKFKSMLDSQLIKIRFEQAQDTYHQQAYVQKQIANSLLLKLLDNGKNFNNILEVGCGTGFLTKLIEQQLTYNNLILNDLYLSKHLTTPYSLFLQGDISKISLPKNLNLIISSSTIQWLNNLQDFFTACHNSLANNGVLCFSTFLPDNFFELNNILKAKPNYLSIEQLNMYLSPLFKELKFTTQTMTLGFSNPLEILRHIKATGVNAIYTQSLTKGQLLKFCKDIALQNKTAVDGQENSFEYNLSYKIVYVIAKGKLYAK